MKVKELTVTSISLGIIIGVVMTAANVYLGLYAGMTVSASIPAAWTLWSSQIRYLGVGAMLVGGVWSIISVRRGFTKGIGELRRTHFIEVNTVILLPESIKISAL